MKKITLILFLLPFLIHAQTNIDSLKIIWNKIENPDSVRIKAIDKIIWEGFMYSNPDSAFYYAQKSYEYAQQKGLKEAMANALTAQGASLMTNSDYIEALKYYKQSLEISINICDSFSVAHTLNNIGTIYTKLKDYTKTIDYHNQSIDISTKIKDNVGVARSLLNKGLIYNRMHQNDKALDYYNQCLEICLKIKNQEGASKCYNNIGNIYGHKKQYDKALEYYLKALELHEILGNEIGIGETVGNIGVIYQLIGDYSNALNYQRENLTIQQKVKNRGSYAGALINIGNIYFRQNMYDSALFYGSQSMKIAQKFNSITNISSAAELQYNIYKRLNQNNKALLMFELFVSTRDSLMNIKNHDEIVRIEYRHKYVSDSLKRLQSIELEKITQQKEAHKATYRLYFIIVLFLFVLTIIGILLKIKSIKIKSEKDYLLKEIQILKSVAVINIKSSTETTLNEQLNRDAINRSIEGTLNDTDWNILTLLSQNPTINNREISEQISLSFEGVRSSLKKMYRVFDIKNTTENQRIALVIEAIRISSNNNMKKS